MNNKDIWNRRYLYNQVKSRNILNPTIRYVWSIINQYAGQGIKNGCIDVGCGDHSFWKYFLWWYRSCDSYIGIDISDVQITENAKRFRKNDRKIFLVGNSADLFGGLRRNVVLCIDLLFHILDDSDYEQTIRNLCEYSKNWIILTNWSKEPKKYNKEYQQYRDFNEYQYIFEECGFKLIKAYNIPSNDTGAIYIYRERRYYD